MSSYCLNCPLPAIWWVWMNTELNYTVHTIIKWDQVETKVKVAVGKLKPESLWQWISSIHWLFYLIKLSVERAIKARKQSEIPNNKPGKTFPRIHPSSYETLVDHFKKPIRNKQRKTLPWQWLSWIIDSSSEKKLLFACSAIQSQGAQKI